MNSKALLALAGLSLAAAPVALGQIITNPSFDPLLGGWTFIGRTFVAPPGYTESDGTWPAPTSGNQDLDIYSNGGVSQDITLSASTSYKLTFDLASLIPPAPLGYHLPAGVTVDIGTGLGASIVGGPQPFSVPFGTGFQSKELDFTTTTGGSFVLEVIGAGDGTYSFLDNFNITAVPEPAAYAALAGVGLAAWGVWRRFRR